MDTATWLSMLQRHRAIALLRSPTVDLGMAMATAAVAGGFRMIEVAWTSAQPETLLTHLRHTLPADCVIGAGTVLTPAAAQAAIAAGAQFCFSPHTDADLMRLCQQHAVPVIPGALTPTEIIAAWHLGADSVKIFPCAAMGGVDYVRHLQGPLPQIPLIPCGGIEITTAPSYIEAGAIAIGMASSVFPKALITRQDWSAVRQRAHQCMDGLQSVRAAAW
jgi:2-dehydro-3-deoxyphosphogluconate aldolase/(4S)-4-hydroxy-2-oxoglutarate aldolase